MMTNTNRAAIESLQHIALTHGLMEFCHLCTSALKGREWAVERLSGVVGAYFDVSFSREDAMLLAAIKAVDTVPPIKMWAF